VGGDDFVMDWIVSCCLGRESHKGRFAVRYMSCFRVLMRRATGGERRMICADVVLVPSGTVRLVADLVDLNQLAVVPLSLSQPRRCFIHRFKPQADQYLQRLQKEESGKCQVKGTALEN
jgi:hypothetical protein